MPVLWTMRYLPRLACASAESFWRMTLLFDGCGSRPADTEEESDPWRMLPPLPSSGPSVASLLS